MSIFLLLMNIKIGAILAPEKKKELKPEMGSNINACEAYSIYAWFERVKHKILFTIPSIQHQLYQS